MKLAFLVLHETPSRGGDSFYQFLPYRLGPFSFSLYREIGFLVKEGFIKETDKKQWEVLNKSSCKTTDNIEKDIEKLVAIFRNASLTKLVDYVYTRYPWYTANSEIKRLAQLQMAIPAIYTLGYEGTSIDRFLNRLLQEGVQRVIDVRHNPISRRYGFHKSTLNNLCNKIDIEYLHIPEVGIPSDLRKKLSSQIDYRNLFDNYEKGLKEKTDFLQTISFLMEEKASVLVCMEKDAAFCHRSRLAKAISQINNQEIIHLK